jgi:hypothetical protein
MTPTSDTVRQTSRARIGHLERNVSSLWNAVQNLQSRLGYGSSEVAFRPPPQSHVEDDSHIASSDEESVSDQSDLSPPNPPTHLMQLFNNDLLGSWGYGPADLSKHSPSLHKAHASLELRRLIPPREDMVVIAQHATSWLKIYNELFPVIEDTGDGLLPKYEKIQDPNTDTVTIAAFVLTVALTVQQAPDDTSGSAVKSISDAAAYIKEVSDTVDRLVVRNDVLAATLDGIEVALVSLRL